MGDTFEVPLMLFLKANPHTIYIDRTVIIRPEWGIRTVYKILNKVIHSYLN